VLVTTRIVHRPARTIHPPVGQGSRQIEAPPTLPDEQGGGNQLMAILPMVGMMGSLTLMTVMRNPAFMGLGAVMLVVAVLAGAGMLLSRRGQVGRQRRNQRERYLDYLEELRENLGREEREIRTQARLLDPPPEALYDVVRDPTRLWERRRRHPDFLKVRIGTGYMPGDPLVLGEQGSALTPTDPFMASEAKAAIRRFETMPDMPLTVPLDIAGNVSVIGAREDVMRLMRSLLLQVTVFHAPGDIAIAVAHAGARTAEWDWLRCGSSTFRRDGGVNARLIAPTPLRLGALLSDDLRQRSDFAAEIRRGMGKREAYRLMRRLLVVHDTHGEVADELIRPDEGLSPQDLGTTVIHLVADQIAEPGEVSVRMTVAGDQVRVEDLRGETPMVLTCTVDDVSDPMMSGLARMLAPIRLSRESLEEEAHAGNVDFTSLMNVDDPSDLDMRRLWAPRTERTFLRVPIGGPADHPRPQGVGPAGHGAARPVRGGHRIRQERDAPDAGARARRLASAGPGQHGAGRLQGRRDVRAVRGPAARRGRHHQPGGRRRPDRTGLLQPRRRGTAPPAGPQGRRQHRQHR
jgi:S-DNA-T family DNA segregation ATPase FtsK/SpoIIIE